MKTPTPAVATGEHPRDRRALLLGTGLALVLLAGLLVAAGPRAVLAPLVGADVGLAGLAVAFAAASLACRHLAYALLCRRTGASPVGPRFHLWLLVAGVPRWLLPFGYVGGPFINASYLARGVGARFESTAAALAVSEVLALVASGFVLGVGFLLVVLTGGTAPAGNLALVGVTFVALSGLAALAFAVGVDDRLAGVVTVLWIGILAVLDRFGPSRTVAAAVDRVLGERVRRFRGSLSTVATDRRAVAGAFLVNALAWLLGVVPLYLCARAVGLPVPIGVVMLTVPLAAAAGFVPVPAGIGATELAYAGLLVTLAGAAPATATAATLLYRLSTLGFELLAGGLASGYVLLRRG